MRRSSHLRAVSSRPSGDFNLRFFAVIFYLGLAFLLTMIMPMSEAGLFVIVLVGVAYQLFLRRQVQRSPHFRQNIWLMALLLILLAVVYTLPFACVAVLGAIYLLLVGRNSLEPPYFLRFHILTALIGYGMLLFPFLLGHALLALGMGVANLANVGALVLPVAAMLQTGLLGLYLVAFWGLALYLSFHALRGGTPYVFLVSGNVRHWA